MGLVIGGKRTSGSARSAARRASLPCPSFPSWSWHWSELGLNPKAGLEFGLDLAVADKEGAEKPVSTDWAGLPRFDLPAHWGTATLGE